MALPPSSHQHCTDEASRGFSGRVEETLLGASRFFSTSYVASVVVKILRDLVTYILFVAFSCFLAGDPPREERAARLAPCNLG